MSMPTCPNTSYVSDEVYKCKFCCSSKVSYILLNVIIMQLSYIMSTLFHFPPQIQVVLVTTACLKNRTYHSIPSLLMLKYMERLFNFNVYKKIIFYRSEDYNRSEDMYIRSIIGIVLGIMFILVAVLIVVIVYMRRKMLSKFPFLVMFLITNLELQEICSLLFLIFNLTTCTTSL